MRTKRWSESDDMFSAHKKIIRAGKPPAWPGHSSSLAVSGRSESITRKVGPFPLTPALSSGERGLSEGPYGVKPFIVPIRRFCPRSLTPALGALATLFVLVTAPSRALAGDEEGVAVAIVYDTSGSMKGLVRDGTGKKSPKYEIANRALAAIAQRLQHFSTNTAGGPPRSIEAGLFIFSGKGAREAIPFGPFDAKAIEAWAKNFYQPDRGTPLGRAVEAAGKAVLHSKLSRKHVLVITDGLNNVGPDPASAMSALKVEAEQKKTALSVHFVAFDVDAKVFDPVKKLGATVVGAADEPQLKTQLEFILQRKILLEDEEPPAKK